MKGLKLKTFLNNELMCVTSIYKIFTYKIDMGSTGKRIIMQRVCESKDLGNAYDL